jgi:hypothetical protein
MFNKTFLLTEYILTIILSQMRRHGPHFNRYVLPLQCSGLANVNIGSVEVVQSQSCSTAQLIPVAPLGLVRRRCRSGGGTGKVSPALVVGLVCYRQLWSADIALFANKKLFFHQVLVLRPIARWCKWMHCTYKSGCTHYESAKHQKQTY